MEVKKKLLIASVIAILFLTACKNNKDKVLEKETSKIELQDTKFLDEMESKTIYIDYKLSKFTPKVADYNIANDFSNVENISNFGNFTTKQKEMLLKNGFTITKPKNQESNEYSEDSWNYEFDQIHQIYEDNEYNYWPSFVTTDSVTHIFHIFYDGFLRSLEREELYPKSIELNKNLLVENIKIYDGIENKELKDLQIKNIAFVATGLKLLGFEPENLPEEAKDLMDEEIKNVILEEIATSAISDRDVDFSQLIARGHYTRDEKLKKYFMGTMYFGQVGFFIESDGEMDKDSILQGLLLTHSIYRNPKILKIWEDLVEPIDFLVESADDLSIREYARTLYGVYGKDFDINKLDEEKNLMSAYEVLKAYPDPKIAGFLGKSFRYMPQRAVIDSVLMQNVVDIASEDKPSDRPIYSGLDLMAAFGNERARDILNKDSYNSHWDKYKERTEGNILTVNKMEDKQWQKNMYRGWLWMLDAYDQKFGEGYPRFMRNEAWERKNLVSALGSFAELKHDTVLYGKAVIAEMGGGEDEEIPKSYVEPNVELYEKLNWLLEFTKTNLKSREMLSENLEDKIKRFQTMVVKLRDLSIKELQEEPFTEDENQYLLYIGGEMESIMVDFVKSSDENQISSWYEIENATDRRMPVVVDLMRIVDNNVGLVEGEVFHIGTGKPMEIYVIYPHEGKLYMGRGAIFSYYEFINKDRLKDEKWQEMVYNDETDFPNWYNDLVTEEKEIP
ncbi:DUF3160 domain-containing protein [Peptoniphilus porci]|uniref:DUF3160 domain-containing protein n=1 Tax=Peptoniphilus porci TaxID=2652280 RepID=A0A1U7LYE4_9FIRM|nr:DUF3160 domain-containing protein [Peptoniphilus porci]OLR64413.1 hypothetical protein BIV18_02045 [Peptoniphilus porci]